MNEVLLFIFAVYAFNFYEKVEEAFRSSNRPDDCKKFNSILKSFDPKKDKVSNLYYVSIIGHDKCIALIFNSVFF